MQTLDKERVPTDQTAKNIRYLRQSINLNITDFAELIEIDPINIYQFEKHEYVVGLEEGQDEVNNLIDIANYFAVKLDVLVLNDLEKENLIEGGWFESLKNERAFGKKANRIQFYKEVINYEKELSDGITREDLMREFFRQLHQLAKIKDRYYNFREAGRIDKIDFFE